MNVQIECPVCKQPLEADVTIINDSEGDGLWEHHFQALDDYTIDWKAHHETVMALDDDDGPNIKYMRLGNHTCEQLVEEPTIETVTLWNGQTYERETRPLDDKLIERLAEAGIKAYADWEPDHD